MATAAPERMSRVDTAWLRMDNPSNLMMILGVWLLEPGVSHAALCQRVEERLLKYRRFRQKVVEDAMGASWVEDEDFDIAAHVVPEPLTRARGQSWIGERRYPHGSPSPDPSTTMSNDELVAKFVRNAEGVLAPRATDEAVMHLLNLEKVPDVASVIRLLTPEYARSY